MNNEKYITSETTEGRWAILCYAHDFGLEGIEVKCSGIWTQTNAPRVEHIIEQIKEYGNVYRIPNPDYVEPWPVGTVLEHIDGGRGVVVCDEYGDDRKIQVLDEDIDLHIVHPSQFGLFKPTGEHIDLSPLLGENQ